MGSERQARGWVVSAIALAGTGLRLAWPAGLDLYGDEAYYWLWSRHPAFGYFDHPPLVAWLAALGDRLGHEPFWLRAPFACCGGLSIWLAAELAAELTEAAAAPALAALLTALAPVLVLTSGMALPDGPLTTCVTAALWLFLRGLRLGRDRELVATGAALGLAALSKYTAAMLAPGLILIGLRDPAARAALRRPGIWLGLGLAAAIFAPCAVWNAQHGFLSFRYQVQHAIGDRFSPRTLGSFAATELLGAGPLTLVLGLSFLTASHRPATRRLEALLLPCLGWFALAALRGRFEANWPAFLDPALCAAAAAKLSAGGSQTGRGQRRALALTSALTLAVILGAALELHHPRAALADSIEIVRFHQGRALADAVRLRLKDLQLEPEPPFVTTDYQDAAELAYYGGFTRLGPALEHPSQLDLWDDLPGAGEAFAYVGTTPPGAALARHYLSDRPDLGVRFELTYEGASLRQVVLARLRDFRGHTP